MTPKKIVALNLAILAVGCAVWLFSRWDEMDVIGQFGAFLLVSIGVALFGAIFVLPAIGEWIGNLFYSSPEEVQPDIYNKAAAKLAQGDYDGAIKIYRSIAKDEPNSRFPHVEISKIQLEHLEDANSAIGTIQTALDSRDWPEDDAAFFMFRLAKLYDSERNATDTAKEFLNRVIETFPNTRHAGNARHQLNEIAQGSRLH